MHTFDRSIHAAGTPAPPRLAGVVVFTLMLFVSACSDATAPTAPADSPSLLASAKSHSWFATSSLEASGFAVLANAAVTCTNGDITGDVGTYLAKPTAKFTKTKCPVVGAVHLGDSEAQAAYDAFVDQYEALAPAPGECTIDNTLTGTLANDTLAAGTYCVSAVAKTGVLTLTGSGSWTFKVLGALTGTNFTVVMADGAVACDVTWWVEGAATMTTSDFKGNILAGEAITLTGGTFYGNAWAGASGVGDVTITGTETIGCEGSNGGDNGNGNDKGKCNQGVGNGAEGCDPGNSNHMRPSNDENGGTPGNPGRKGKP